MHFGSHFWRLESSFFEGKARQGKALARQWQWQGKLSASRASIVPLVKLERAGGNIYRRSGHNHRAVFGSGGAHLTGHMHQKIVVVDRRIGYIGSINLTRSSETNVEGVLKVKGPIVKELVQAVLDVINDR